VCLRAALLFLACVPTGNAVSMQAHFRANPIRKVVTMLQDMQQSVEAEGEKEKELYEKFMCSCQSQGGSLESNIASSNQKIGELSSKIESNAAQKSQLDQDVVSHKSDREEAEKTVKESTAMRGKEASEFAASSGEMKANVQAMGGALAALKKGLSASLLQTGVADLLRHIVSNSPAVSDEMRGPLLSFLSGGNTDSEEMEGSSDQIIGIVEQMKETMEGDLKETEASEAEAKASFGSLMEAKTKEISAASSAIEEKTARVGTLAVEVVQGKADLEGTENAMDEDVKFKANLAKSCSTKSTEFDQRSKTRAEEMQALSETVEMLNGDDALELFKKALPSSGASVLLQTSTSTRSQQRHAVRLLENVMSTTSPSHMINVKLMLLALKSKHRSGGAFDKVAAMIDNMIVLLKKEEADDNKQKDFCIAELDKTEDEKKALEGEVADLEATIEEMTDAVSSLQSEWDGLRQGLADLDKNVAIATQQRKAEHEEYIQTSSANQAALDLITMAKNRMNKFYNPDQYKEPEPTPGPDAFVQLSARRSAVDDSLTALGGHKKTESGGVLAMMSQLMKDVELDMQEGKLEEANAQKDYEEAMSDAATKRTDDSKLMVTKEGEKAELASKLEDTREAKGTKDEQRQISAGTLMDLHRTCDNLLKNFDAQKESRAKEIEGLSQSKAVLSGANMGLLQLS